MFSNNDNNNNNNNTTQLACANPNDSSKKSLKDTQFFQKLCSKNITTNKFALNKIKSKDSSNTQSAKFASYVNNGKYISIFEGRIKELSMIFATANSAKIVFVPVGYMKSLTLNIQNQQNTDDSQSIDILTSPYIIENLRPNSRYDITSIAKYSSGNKYTELFTNAVQTLNEGPPTKLKLSKLTNKTALITFTKPIGIPTSVTIRIKNETYDYFEPNIITEFFEISGLQINTSYTFLITSIYTVTKNTYSVTFPFTTLYEEFPTDITFTNITNENATISYRYTGTPLYNIIYVVNNENAEENYIENTLENSRTFVLTSNVTYNVTITSVYSSGNKYPVETLNAFYILNEGLPQNITILSVKGTTFLFSFEKAIGNPSYYELLLQSPSEIPVMYPINISNTQNILIGGDGNIGLTPNTRYTFQLTSKYLQTGNIYTYNSIIQTLNEGVIKDFVVTYIGNIYVSFTFTNPPGDNYLFNIIFNNDFEYKSVNINTNTYTFPNLLIDTSYNIIVNAVYSASNTTYTYNYPTTIRTKYEGFSIMNYAQTITNNNMYIAYSNPYLIPDKYIFITTNVNNPTNIIITEETTSGTVFIDGMFPNSTYITTLDTVYRANTLDETMYRTDTTIQINTKGSPTNIITNEWITDTNVSIFFVAPIVLQNKYKLILNRENPIDISNNAVIIQNGISYLEINNLIPNTYYEILFGGYYLELDTTYYSPLFTFTTKGPVRNIQISNITDNVATLEFDSPLLSYNWTYTIRWNGYNYTGITDTRVLLTDLIQNKFYNVEIEAIYSESQVFKNTISFYTKSPPYNITITDILDTQVILNWEYLNNIPDRYTLIYENHDNHIIMFTSENVKPNLIPDISNSYVLSELIPDSSYNIITLSTYYSDNNTTYTTTKYISIITKSAPTEVHVLNQTNRTIEFEFKTPYRTFPTKYNISAVNITNKNDFMYQVPMVVAGTVYNYRMTDLSDNVNYNIYVNSYYADTNTMIMGVPIRTSTHGTPNILSFTNIYTNNFTINIQPLFIPPPLNYSFSFYNIRTRITDTITGEITESGQFTTPSIFIQNDTYNVTIQSIYSNSEIYTSITKPVSLSSYPTILSYISTDISAILYFTPPLNPPTYYNYFVSNTKTSEVPIYKDINNNNYFIVDALVPTTINTIYLDSYYSDINQSYSSDSIIVYTKGAPSNLIIEPEDIFNTYVNVSFTTSFQCSMYTIYAVPIETTKTILFKTINDSPLFTTKTIQESIYGLLEDMDYTIYVTSNYDNFIGKSNVVNIKTFEAIRIQEIIGITDVSATVIISTHPSILPAELFFSYTLTNNQTTTIEITDIYNSTTNENYYIFTLLDLSPNTYYDEFKIRTEYINNENKTRIFISEENPFSTKGITNITTFITDISATISFPTPYTLPSQYYYAIEEQEPIPFIPTTINSITQYTIGGLPPNTYYPYISIQTQYTDDTPNIYNSINIPFYTKLIPTITSFVVSDTQLDISFIKVISPDISYIYVLDLYTYNFPEVIFTPTIDISDPTIGSLSISNLIPNTFYDIFKIDICYNDGQKYSSVNRSFNTMGSPTSAVLHYPPNDDNSITLSFYPPLYYPDSYIIRSLSNPTTIYNTDMTYVNNVYTYNIPIQNQNTKFTDIHISSYYASLNKTIDIDIFHKIHTLPSVSNIVTNNTGNAVAAIATSNSTNIYNSFDYGKTWISSTFSQNIIQIVMDTTGLIQYALSSTSIYKSNQNQWNTTAIYTQNGYTFRNIGIDNSGQTIFVTSSTNSIFSIDFGNSWTIHNSIQNASKCIVNNSYVYCISSTSSVIQIPKINLNSNGNIISGLNNIQQICSSIDNTNILCIEPPNDSIQKSIDGGNNFNVVDNSRFYKTTIYCDYNGFNVIATNAMGLYISTDGGTTWNYLLETNKDFINAIFSGDGTYIYAYNATDIYSYKIPVKKGSAHSLQVTNILDTSTYFTFYQPTFIPDLSYTIVVTNSNPRINDTHSYSTFQNINYILDGLTPNATYNIALTTNYSNILQSFTTNLPSSFTTKSAPINFNILGNPTDSSANLEFIEPMVIPDYYILQINDISYIILNTSFTTKVVRGIAIGYYLQPNNINLNNYIVSDLSRNTFYNITLSSYYTDLTLQKNKYISNTTTFYTRGYPTDLSINDIYDTFATISFTYPKNTNNVENYTITLTSPTNIYQYDVDKNRNNTIITDLSENTIYNIQLSTNYTNPLQTIVSDIYTSSLYTKGGPTIQIFKNENDTTTTDTSAILQIVNPPISIQNNNRLFLKYQLDISNTIFDITRILSSDISYIILTGLTQNTNYYNNISIKTFYTDISTSTFVSNRVTLATKGYPANIKSDFNYIQGTHARITFSPAWNPPENYTVFISTDNQGNNQVNTSTIDSSFIDITGLSLGTLYYISVQSNYNNNMFIRKSPYSSFRTASSPSFVQVYSVRDTSMNIIFVTPILSPSKYTILIKRKVDNLITNQYDISNTYVSTQANPLQLTLINLPSNTELYTVVQSVYPSITLSSSLPNVSFITYGPPRNIIFEQNSITDTSVNITFTPPYISMNISSYNINLKNKTTNDIRNINNVTSPYIITDLSENTTYELNMYSVYSDGLISTTLQPIGFHTQGKPTNIEEIKTTSNETTIGFNLCPSTPNSYDLNINNQRFLNIIHPYTISDLYSNSNYSVTILSNYANNSWNILF